MLSAPQRQAQTAFSTSSSIDEVVAELPMFALIFTKKLRPKSLVHSLGDCHLELQLFHVRSLHAQIR